MTRWIRRIPMIVIAAGVVALIVYAFLPKPVPVDMAAVARGELRVTVDEDGQTRIKERYVISAPLAGRLMRIELDPGDDAVGGQTMLAMIEPRDPELLDPRARAEADARVEAARASVQQAEANSKRAVAMLELARTDAQRVEQAAKANVASAKELDDARLLEQVRTQEVNAAQFASQIAAFQLKLAEAALLRTRPGDQNPPDSRRLEIRAPCNGRVLRVFQKSEGFVNAGAALIEFGDPTELECVVDVLSTDAVKIKPGGEVQIEHWGGAQPLRGRVRLIEPSAFTKVSSLGIEEQRVNVIVDFVDPPARRQGLGDGYRIEASIIVWQDRDVLKVPAAALFRHEQQWAVFRVEGGRAVRQVIQLGQRSGLEAQVLSGLAAGDRVIVHPSDKVSDGVKVEPR